MAHVIISYAHANTDFAAMLMYKLGEAGISAWIDSEQLRAGKDWRTGIDQAIEDSFALIVVMTPEAKASEYVTYEWAYALGAKKTVIPILLAKTPMHPRLEVLQYLDFTDFDKRPWDRLIRHLQEIQGEQTLPSGKKVASEHSSYIQQLVIALNDANPATRQSAAASLGQLKDRAVVANLLGALRDKKAAVREAAAKSLGAIGDAGAVSGLLGLLHDSDYEVREAAAKALGQIGDPAAVAGLSQALRDNDKWVRAAARRALTQIGTAEAQEAIHAWDQSE